MGGSAGAGVGVGPGRAAPKVVADALVRVFGAGQTAVRALDGVSVTFADGAFTAITGPSGSGKSSLLHCLAGLDRPQAGRALIDGVDLTTLSDRALTRLRRDRIGFVFQSFNLVPTLTAGENVTLPLEIAGRPVDRAWVGELVDTLGIGGCMRRRPSQLSGGQQQRVAVARAMVSRPAVIFADEPTGNLDSRTGHDLLSLVVEAVRRYGQTVVMVTHDPAVAARSDRVVFLVDGRVVDDLEEPSAAGVLERMRSLWGEWGDQP